MTTEDLARTAVDPSSRECNTPNKTSRNAAAAELVSEALSRAEYSHLVPPFRAASEGEGTAPSRIGYRLVKRAFDIAFSSCALVALALPGAILAVAIRLESSGNPFYGQVRIGQVHGDGSLSTFRMWKFRSMYKDADKRLEALLDKSDVEGAMFKMHDDPRVTHIGRFIRKHSIDEVPQFFNVLLGNMSVVGPRPPLPREVEQYTSRDLQRLAVKPGITGLWQVSGRSDIDFADMVNLDLDYIRTRSVATDLSIILRTVRVVFTGEGAA